jgi:hypothetical protein
MSSGLAAPSDSLSSAITQILPLPLMVVTTDMSVVHVNPAAVAMLEQDHALLVEKRCGEVLECLHALQTPGGCGHTAHCPDCTLRKAVLEAQQSGGVFRDRATVRCADGQTQLHFLVTAMSFEFHGERLTVLVLEEINSLVHALGMLPICAACHKIRDSENRWHNPSDYLNQHLQIEFTHGLCPDCIKDYFPDRGSQGGLPPSR